MHAPPATGHRFTLYALALAVLALAVLAGACGPAAAASGDDARRSLERFFSGLRSLEAGFEQTVSHAQQGVVERSRGTVTILRPGRFRWHYRAPYEQLIVTDGETLWVYDPDLEQAARSALGESIGNTPALLLSSERPLEQWFHITDLGRRDGLAWVRLEPRDEQASFSRIHLAFEGGALRAMELSDDFGQTILIRFDDVRRNVAPDPSLFDFRPPPGVDVVGRGAD